MNQQFEQADNERRALNARIATLRRELQDTECPETRRCYREEIVSCYSRMDTVARQLEAYDY
jgi:hypothetical protein